MLIESNRTEPNFSVWFGSVRQKSNRLPTPINNDVKPRIGFLGKVMAKSFSRYLEVRIERKNDKAVTEKHKATNDEMAKVLKAGSFSRIGLLLCSLRPLGTVAEVANAAVAISAATTKHDSKVLASHSVKVGGLNEPNSNWL